MKNETNKEISAITAEQTVFISNKLEFEMKGY